MNAADARLIEQIKETTRGGSRALVTLARRGKAIERDDAERARSLLTAVATHPLYKGGRLTFDMLEIEDLMLDESPIEPISTADLIQILNAGGHNLAETLRRMGAPVLDARRASGSNFNGDMPGSSFVRAGARGADASSAGILPHLTLGPTDARHTGYGTAEPGEPELTSSDYLYDYVVLGFLDVLGRIMGNDGRAFFSETSL